MASNSLGPDSGPVDISIDVEARLRARGVSVLQLAASARDKIWGIVDELAFLLGEFIDEVWPVDTGASQADWESTAEGFEWVIRNPREYAGFVHRQGQTGLVYKQIARRSEELLTSAWSRIVAASKETEPLQPTPSRLAAARRFLLPSTVGPSETTRGTLFTARVAGFLNESTRARERSRQRAR